MADIAIVHTTTWDETKPAGSRAKSLGDDDIRDNKKCERERQAIDHKRYADESAYTDAGTHKKVTLTEIQAAKPTAYSNCGYLYLKDVSAVVELFWEDESGNEIQITSGGKILGDNVRLSNNTYLTAKDAAGTGTVNLIKANATDDAVLPDGAEMASSAAPTTDVQIVNKKYVDDNKFVIGDITGIIRAWASRTVNTVYTEGVDGFVVGSITKTDNSNGFVTMQTPNGTIRQKIGGYPNGNYQYSAFMCPVAKAATWRLVSSGTITVDYLWFIPIGS
jgi:hypothetical protein